jgi:hypothetical protein
MGNEVNKTIQCWRLQCWYCWREWFMRHIVERASNGMIYIPSFMKTGWDIRAIPLQFERSSCLYYQRQEFHKYAVEMVSGGVTYVPSFMTIGSSIRVLLRVLPQQFERLLCWYFWWGNGDVRLWDGLRWYDTYIPIFMKIGTGVQAILRFCLSNLNGCNVENTDGKVLWSAPLKWVQVEWYTYQVSSRLLQVLKEY